VTRVATRRVLVLAGIALLAAVVALVVIEQRRSRSPSTLPLVVPIPGGGWYHATAAVRSSRLGRRTSCGLVVTAKLGGLSDPVLPCGAKIYIEFGKRRALTQVIDRTSGAPDHRFDLTQPLADQLGLSGVQPVRWAFARSR
jgi:hypothetical protein